MTPWNDPELAAMAEELADIDRTIDVKYQLALSHDRLLSAADIEDMPLPPWLLTQFLIDKTLACIAGQPGEGKTFLALDWALSIASGEPWLGHEVSPGPTVFVAAEGSAGLGPRIRAWKQYHGVDELPAWFLARSIQMLELEDVERFNVLVGSTLQEKPRLIVIDTMARCMVGGDENKVEAVSQFVEACAVIQRAHECAVLIVHHLSKDGAAERGSSALRGAVDMLGFLRKTPEGVLTLSCEKQKDHLPWNTSRLQLTPYGESCILKPPLGLDLGRETHDVWDE